MPNRRFRRCGHALPIRSRTARLHTNAFPRGMVQHNKAKAVSCFELGPTFPSSPVIAGLVAHHQKTSKGALVARLAVSVFSSLV